MAATLPSERQRLPGHFRLLALWNREAEARPQEDGTGGLRVPPEQACGEGGEGLDRLEALAKDEYPGIQDLCSEGLMGLGVKGAPTAR